MSDSIKVWYVDELRNDRTHPLGSMRVIAFAKYQAKQGEIDRLTQQLEAARALLNPVCAEETLCGAIRNLQQAHLMEKGNAEEAIRQLAATRKPLTDEPTLPEPVEQPAGVAIRHQGCVDNSNTVWGETDKRCPECKERDRLNKLKTPPEAAQSSVTTVEQPFPTAQDDVVERLQELCEEFGCPAGVSRFEFLHAKLASKELELDFDPDAQHSLADMANIGYEFMCIVEAGNEFYNTSPVELFVKARNERDDALAALATAREGYYSRRGPSRRRGNEKS